MALTKISDLVNPTVMADMISAKIEKKIVVAPFAKVDDTLTGVAGDTIVVPQYSYIGDADDVAEGVAVGTTKLVTTTTEATIKKAMKAVELSDEAVLSGYGNPIGETNNQLAMAIAAKVDNDAMDALQTASLEYETNNIISYDGIIDAIDVFGEEMNCRKVIFVHPSQLTQLRHDEDFISREKYLGDVLVTGEIGIIANTVVVPSKKVPVVDGHYVCPIVKISEDKESEDETPALTIYLKRDTNVETERQSLKRVTDISVDKFYTVVLSNESKVVLAKFATAAAEAEQETETETETEQTEE
ncbi:MAG: N4-gp56 family major capsid protein [Clostridia bacterium]|nr:N4-gp56 family major capsid protein [Clostridia bacterium]